MKPSNKKINAFKYKSKHFSVLFFLSLLEETLERFSFTPHLFSLSQQLPDTTGKHKKSVYYGKRSELSKVK